MSKPVHCCPKHQFPLDRKGEQCPICREEIEDEYGEPDDDDFDDTCTDCNGRGRDMAGWECNGCDGTGKDRL